jgi:membrane fusion protein, copper/silver efflux system
MLTNDAQSMREAAKQRLRNWDISDAQIRRIEETGKPSRTLTLYSPVNGYVVQKMAIRGMRAMPGEKLFDIADLSSVWVIADIYEQELPPIKVNQAAVISISSFPGKEFRSRIDYVYPTISGDTRTARARFTIPNPGGRLKPQMFANVEIKIDMGKKLAIPDSAVIDSGRRQVVYVDKGEGVFEPREVMLGVTADGLREVLMGLKAGERVASSGTFLIDSEAQLKGVAPLGGHKH